MAVCGGGIARSVAGKSVKLSTTSFRDTPANEMSLDEVLRVFKELESKRERGDGAKQFKQYHISGMVNELSSSLSLLSFEKAISLSLVVRCMSHQVIAWYENELKMDDLYTNWWSVYRRAKKGHSGVRRQMEQLNFKPLFPFESGDVWYDVPNGVIVKLSQWGRPFGASVYTLLSYGLAWCLLTLEDGEWDKGNRSAFFAPEVAHFKRAIECRRIDLDGFAQKMDVGDGGKK